jgi:multidrug resistance efflux pump
MSGLEFSHTLRSLHADGARPVRLAIGLATFGLAVWTLWLFCARISVFTVSDNARVEMTSAFPVEATVRGDVTATRLRLGVPVKAGDVLVELNSGMLRIALKEKRALVSNLTAQIAALNKQLAAEDDRILERQRLLQERLAEAEAHSNEASVLSRYADLTLARARALLERGMQSAAEHDRADADARARRAMVDASQVARERVAAEGRVEQTDIRQDMARLRRELEALRGQEVVTEAEVSRLTMQIDQFLIRAPATGHLGEIAKLEVGGVLQVGQKVATVVPDGSLNLVAEYNPVDAVGRIHPGQAAYLRLAGFPSIRYGTIQAQVARVGNETREGHVRVDLAVSATSQTAVPLRHGMPGTVDIEIERVAPVTLLFRSVVGVLR